MTDRAYLRLTDMKNAIGNIRRLLDGKTSDAAATDIVARAAYERFLEIVSEASKHVPNEWKDKYPAIEWRQIADLGNFIRHAYHRIDFDILWAVYIDKLDALEQAIDALIAHANPDASHRPEFPA